MNKESKLLVCLFSDPNFLAVNILENLLANKCVVNIISDQEKMWDKRTDHIADKSKFFLTSIKDYADVSNFSYAIFCGGFINKKSAMPDFKKFISNKNFGSAKTLAVFPFETFSFKAGSLISINENAGIVYVGDLLGARIDLESGLLVPKLIKEMIEKRSLTMGVGELFYPVFVSDASKTITKWLLSFGPYGKETFLLGPQTSSSDFWKQNIKSFPDLKVVYDTDIQTRPIPKGYDIKRVDSNLNFILRETYRWIISDSFGKKTDKPESLKDRSSKSVHGRFWRVLLPVLFIILFFPLLTTLSAGTFLYISYRNLLSEKVQSAQKNALLAKTLFVVGKRESDILASVPVLGRPYKETSFVSYVGELSSETVANIAPLTLTGKNLLSSVLSNQVYDVAVPSRQIKSGLEFVYKQISLLQISTEEYSRDGVMSAAKLSNLIDFNKYKNLTQQGIVLSDGLPAILGSEDNKSYLVLFQNNMELRPTGGFIGSYGIADFGGGKLNGLAVNDIYSADGQLRGHVEPPSPIKKYLNEANWWFRDSNWDPDFQTSAQRAEWFLGKEMGQQVDGVVAVDLTPIRNILTYTGPIFLPDYNLTISPDNLYEKTQEEAQANFFPGSRKKASFLTALSRVLINDVSNMNSGQRIGVIKSLYDGLESRSIQIYLHDRSTQSAIDKLNWDGDIEPYSCGDDCYSDFLGDIEANVGVNKANYFVGRKIDFEAEVSQQKITRQLTITLQNKANMYLGPSGQYKTYFRIMIPPDAKLLSMTVSEGASKDILTPDITLGDSRQEVGGYVEINPGQTKNIALSWESDIPSDKNIKKYGLFLRKQAGTPADPLSLKITTPSQVVSASPAFALTGELTSTYNTSLGNDFFARLSWK